MKCPRKNTPHSPHGKTDGQKIFRRTPNDHNPDPANIDKQIVTLEGFEDFRGEYDTGIYLVKPQVRTVDGSTIENVIEDYCIDVSTGDIDDSWDEDEEITKRIRDCFYKVRKKKQTPNFKYFRAVVEIYPYSDDMKEVYTILESEGFDDPR